MQRWILVLVAASVAFAFDHAALAQPNPEVPPPEEPKPSDGIAPAAGIDGVRFRGGGALVFGALVFPDVGIVGIGGFEGALGVQFNHVVGLYVAPELDLAFSDVRGVAVSAAAIVDFTIAHVFTIGLGPEAAAYAGAADDVDGAGYGGRLRLSVQPTGFHKGARRVAVTIGFDLRVLSMDGRLEAEGAHTTPVTGLAISPNLAIGMQAF